MRPPQELAIRPVAEQLIEDDDPDADPQQGRSDQVVLRGKPAIQTLGRAGHANA